MPSVIKVSIICGRSLPIMDKSSQLTDAFVTMHFGDLPEQRTAIAWKTLNPVWNTNFRIEVPDDRMLQDEPLVIKVFDYDIVSYNDLIGTVVVDLSCVLLESGPSQVSGWFPLYDTLRGVRGEIEVSVKVAFFGDTHTKSESSAGVMFYAMSAPPTGYEYVYLLDFVEELVAIDDPEHGFADNLRSSRLSNEIRAILFHRVSGELRRLMGKKVLEMCGNAVVGYHSNIDLEADSGLCVARGYGTACRVVPFSEGSHEIQFPKVLFRRQMTGTDSQEGSPMLQGVADPTINALSTNTIAPTASQAGTYTDNIRESSTALPSKKVPIGGLGERALQLQEIHLVTLQSIPSSAVIQIGGIVSARSVKLLTSRRRRATRDAWWSELRNEIRGHARAMGCTYILGYSEDVSIDEDLSILSCSGTAVAVREGAAEFDVNLLASFSNNNVNDNNQNTSHYGNLDNNNVVMPSNNPTNNINSNNESMPSSRFNKSPFETRTRSRQRTHAPCTLCHVPYSAHDAPFPIRLSRCNSCGRADVPDVLFATIFSPHYLQVLDSAVLVEARIIRRKKTVEGESNALEVSNILPFIEYDLHTQLLHKMRLNCVNAAFGVTIQMIVGETTVIGVMTATGMYVPALPLPPPLRIRRSLRVLNDNNRLMVEIQRQLEEFSIKVREKRLSDIDKLASAAAAAVFKGDTTPPQRPSRVISISPTLSKKDDVDASWLGREVSSAGSGDGTAPSPSPSSSSSSSFDSDGDENYEPQALRLGHDKKLVSVIEIEELEIDDEKDEDMMASLLDVVSRNQRFVNTETLPGSDRSIVATKQLLTVVKRVGTKKLPEAWLNQRLSQAFDEVYSYIAFKIRRVPNAVVCGLYTDIQLPDADILQLVVTATVVVEDVEVPITLPEPALSLVTPVRASSHKRGSENQAMSLSATQSSSMLSSQIVPSTPPTIGVLGWTASVGSSDQGLIQGPLDTVAPTTPTLLVTHHSPLTIAARGGGAVVNINTSSGIVGGSSPARRRAAQIITSVPLLDSTLKSYPLVEITPLSFVPGTTVEQYLGFVSLHFIREQELSDDDVVNGQRAHAAMLEALTVLRAHVSARGGNALAGYRVEWNIVEDDSLYSLVTFTGDALLVRYDNPTAYLARWDQ